MRGSERRATLTLESNSAAQTERIGRALGASVTADLVIALKGDLGAGKTTLTRGIAAGLGLVDRVTSPTFTLINEYGSPQQNRLIHVDTYRLGEATSEAMAELGGVGFLDLLDEMGSAPAAHRTVLVIEWADRIADLLPADHLEIRLEHGEMTPSPGGAAPTRRHVTMTAFGPRSAAALDGLSAPDAAGDTAHRDE